MKKLINKVLKKKDNEPNNSRITTDTVADHRERILAGGRKYKYPIQYAKHKLIITAVLIIVAVIILSTALAWWQLYPNQNTSQFMYRITKFIPVPVAKVDGQNVLYSDYLMKYLSSVHYLEEKEKVNLGTEDGERRIMYIKQQSMDDAVADAYAEKLAKDMDISVSEEEVEGYIEESRQQESGEMSEQSYNAIISSYYNWSPEEYRYAIKKKLLRQKVSYSIDEQALSLANAISSKLKKNSKIVLKDLAGDYKDDVSYGLSGWVPKNNQDGGLAQVASGMKVGDISEVVKSKIGDGYYIIKLLKINDDQVNYEYIKIPLTVFDSQLNKIKEDNKVVEYISIPKE